MILSHVLEHIDDPQNFLNDISHISKNFFTEVPDYEANHLNLFRKQVNSDLVYSDADHVSEFDRKELVEILAGAGLEVLKEQFILGVMKFWCVSSKSNGPDKR